MRRDFTLYHDFTLCHGLCSLGHILIFLLNMPNFLMLLKVRARFFCSFKCFFGIFQKNAYACPNCSFCLGMHKQLLPICPILHVYFNFFFNLTTLAAILKEYPEFHHLNLLSRNALVTTQTLLRLIAAAPIIGLKAMPKAL